MTPIEMDYPSVVVISEGRYIKFMTDILSMGSQERVNGAPLSDIKTVSLTVSPRLPDGEVLIRVKGQWVKISEAPALQPVVDEAIDINTRRVEIPRELDEPGPEGKPADVPDGEAGLPQGTPSE